ncbi:hypothetical protein LSAT2_021598 [Lamellibrachia satsuma]|nr:hypothetical protein LSAT2_021598 [Lamellibrachia satsuma]
MDERDNVHHSEICRTRISVVACHRDEQSHVFNPNCRNEVLLMGIKKVCRCPRAATLDLSDETGMVKHLHSHLTDYGTTYFKDRETLVLLRVEQTGEAPLQRTTYVPLLKRLEADKDFLDKINPKFLKPDDRLLRDRRSPRKASASMSSVSSGKRHLSRRQSKQTTPRK